MASVVAGMRGWRGIVLVVVRIIVVAVRGEVLFVVVVVVVRRHHRVVFFVRFRIEFNRVIRHVDSTDIDSASELALISFCRGCRRRSGRGCRGRSCGGGRSRRCSRSRRLSFRRCRLWRRRSLFFLVFLVFVLVLFRRSGSSRRWSRTLRSPAADSPSRGALELVSELFFCHGHHHRHEIIRRFAHVFFMVEIYV